MTLWLKAESQRPVVVVAVAVAVAVCTTGAAEANVDITNSMVFKMKVRMISHLDEPMKFMADWRGKQGAK